MLFRHDNLEVTSRLVEGNYVDINRVIPTDWGTRTVMATADLLKAVRMASIFAKDWQTSCVCKSSRARTPPLA